MWSAQVMHLQDIKEADNCCKKEVIDMFKRMTTTDDYISAGSNITQTKQHVTR